MDSRLSFWCQLAHLLAADLAQSTGPGLSALFREALGVDYAALARRAYETRLGAGVQPLVGEVCNCLDSSSTEVVEAQVALGTRLFELYLALQKWYNRQEEDVEDCATAASGRPPTTNAGSDSGNESSSVGGGSDVSANAVSSVRILSDYAMK